MPAMAAITNHRLALPPLGTAGWSCPGGGSKAFPRPYHWQFQCMHTTRSLCARKDWALKVLFYCLLNSCN